jgi:carbonic anhydrase
MTDIERLLADNAAYVGATSAHQRPSDPRPSRQLAVVSCMDARIDVLGALGLALGEAHVIRNAGGRVTEDVLRSLALSVHVLGVDTVVLMQHTRCGLSGVTDGELRARTGAELAFLAIDDHSTALRRDVEILAATPYLVPVRAMAGLLYDVDSGRAEALVRWQRP